MFPENFIADYKPPPQDQCERIMEGEVDYSWIPALLLTLIFHVAFWVALPFFPWDSMPSERFPASSEDLEVALIIPPEEVEQHYTETNPDVPENEPDKPKHFAARSQQSAQEQVPKKLSDENLPSIKGEDIESSRLLSGQAVETVAPSGEKGNGIVFQEAKPIVMDIKNPQDKAQEGDLGELAPAIKAPEFLKVEKMAEDGLGGHLSEKGIDPSEVKDTSEHLVPLTLNPVVAVLHEVAAQNTTKTTEASEKKRRKGVPRPRPKLISQVRGGPLANRPAGVFNSGALAIDAEFSEFGDYLQRMFDAIGLKWDELNRSSIRDSEDYRAQVQVEFYINRDGNVDKLKVIYTNASEVATWRCVDAIQAPAPYYPWTDEMIQTLDRPQRVRVSFYY